MYQINYGIWLQILQLHIQIVQMVKYAWLMVQLRMKEEWKSVMGMYGERFVMTTGMLEMPMLSVVSQDIILWV